MSPCSHLLRSQCYRSLSDVRRSIVHSGRYVFQANVSLYGLVNAPSLYFAAQRKADRIYWHDQPVPVSPKFGAAYRRRLELFYQRTELWQHVHLYY